MERSVWQCELRGAWLLLLSGHGWIEARATDVSDLVPVHAESSNQVAADDAEARIVAEAALGLALRRGSGRAVHDNAAMRRAAREWRRAGEAAEAA